LPSACTSGSIHSYRHGHPWFSYRGLSPHKFTPMPGVHRMNRIVSLAGHSRLRRRCHLSHGIP
jgi:hypothetical protein